MDSKIFSIHRDVEDRHWWFVARRRIVSSLIRQGGQPHAGGLIIDVGCGTGGTVAGLSNEFPCLGIDSSSEAISYAHAKYPDCEFICGDVSSVLPPLAKRASHFLLMDVLEHIKEDRGFLDALVRQMPSGSHLLVTVPADPSLWSQHDVDAGHVRRYDESGLRNLWAQLPLRERLVTHFNSRLYPLISLAREIERRCHFLPTSKGGDLRVPPAFLNKALTAVFSGEGAVISRALDSPNLRPYRKGVSLLALLQRTN